MKSSTAPAGRIWDIDALRAVAMLLVIVTHVYSYNLGSAARNAVWNYLHFVVPVLIYCSGYVLYLKYKDTRWTIPGIVRWWKKRAMRLALPYYIFFVLHYLLWLLFPAYFSVFAMQKTFSYVGASLLFIGIDYGWLPLLFLELMMLSPLLLTLMRSKEGAIALWGISLGSAMLFFFRQPHTDYRLIMWLPWSAIMLLSFWYARAAAKLPPRRRLVLSLLAAFICFLLFDAGAWIATAWHRDLTLTLHKYPPDIWYLTYGTGIGALLLAATQIRIPYPWITQAVTWISAKSYELFFVHYIVVDVFRTYQHVHMLSLSLSAQLSIALCGSIAIVLFYDLGFRHIRRYFSGK